jgi:hypothetical protein
LWYEEGAFVSIVSAKHAYSVNVFALELAGGEVLDEFVIGNGEESPCPIASGGGDSCAGVLEDVGRSTDQTREVPMVPL